MTARAAPHQRMRSGLWLGLLLLFLYTSSSTVSILCLNQSLSTVQVTNDHTPHLQSLFDDELIPSNSVIDMNVGPNRTPMKPLEGRHRILIEPLFYQCDFLAKLTTNVTTFCFAVSDYTGFSVFREYNHQDGVSSSLSEVTPGTSHQGLGVLSKRTVLVLEAMVLFSSIREKNSTIHRLKLDMQGHELKTLSNIKCLLNSTNLVSHIMAECFLPSQEGRQIYQIDNSCEKISQVLQEIGYETKLSKENEEFGDVRAYKKAVASDFLPDADFES